MTAISAAVTVLKTSLQADSSYAWSWQCNIAMPIKDELNCSHEQANRAAARLMRHLFDVDITTCDEWKHCEAEWTKVPEQA